MARIKAPAQPSARAKAGARADAFIPYEDVARVAYELFERRGRAHGQDQHDWFEAERIVQERRVRPSN